MGRKRHPVIWYEEKARLDKTIVELRERIAELEAQLAFRKSIRRTQKSRWRKIVEFIERLGRGSKTHDRNIR